MGKLIDSTGKKILLGTVLYNGDTTSNFTLMMITSIMII